MAIEGIERTAAARVDAPAFYVQWGAVISGALVAAALSVVLLAFGSAIGFSVASTAPTWRDASAVFAVASGLYLLLSALTAYGLGGYVAGRLRERWSLDTSPDFVEFRDGTHGVLAWAIAVLVSGLVAAALATSVASNSLRPAAAPTASASETLIAYDLDRLFRLDRRPVEAEIAYNRAEAGRILLKTGSREGIEPDDRAYLVRLVMGRTGLAQGDAEHRVDDVIASAHTAIKKARAGGVIVGFSIAVALLAGAAIAWYAAEAGGRHRDYAAPPLRWRFRLQRIPR